MLRVRIVEACEKRWPFQAVLEARIFQKILNNGKKASRLIILLLRGKTERKIKKGKTKVKGWLKENVGYWGKIGAGGKVFTPSR